MVYNYRPRSEFKTVKRGFTLIEIMVVIIIIAVLASVAGPMISGVTDRGKKSATASQLANIKSAITNFRGDCGLFPGTGFAALNKLPDVFSSTDATKNLLYSNLMKIDGSGAGTVTGWAGPYMEDEPALFMKDAWNNPIVYVYVKSTDTADEGIFLLSKGPDGLWQSKLANTVISATDATGVRAAGVDSVAEGLDFISESEAPGGFDMSAVIFKKGNPGG